MPRFFCRLPDQPDDVQQVIAASREEAARRFGELVADREQQYRDGLRVEVWTQGGIGYVPVELALRMKPC